MCLVIINVFISSMSVRALQPNAWEMKPAHTLIFALLLLCTRVEENTATEDEKKVKTDEITEEKNILVLNEKNFVRALSENKYLLVEFCKCFHLLNPRPRKPYI